MDKTTENESFYDQIEVMSTPKLVEAINTEDKKVALAVEKKIPQLIHLIDGIYDKFKVGGRLFYIGAGTSGRLGILDASEIPPTYGLPFNRVIGLIAGGDKAIRKAVEFAEDNLTLAEKDLTKHNFSKNDALIGIAASGTTPYVLGGIKFAKSIGAITGCITNNNDSPLAKEVLFPVEIIVGPEFITGSTRMKSGTAQKMALNIISTTLMAKIGKVKGNKMVHMQLSNDKLIERGIKMLQTTLGISVASAKELLLVHGEVNKAIMAFQNKKGVDKSNLF